MRQQLGLLWLCLPGLFLVLVAVLFSASAEPLPSFFLLARSASTISQQSRAWTYLIGTVKESDRQPIRWNGTVRYFKDKCGQRTNTPPPPPTTPACLPMSANWLALKFAKMARAWQGLDALVIQWGRKDASLLPKVSGDGHPHWIAPSSGKRLFYSYGSQQAQWSWLGWLQILGFILLEESALCYADTHHAICSGEHRRNGIASFVPDLLPYLMIQPLFFIWSLQMGLYRLEIRFIGPGFLYQMHSLCQYAKYQSPHMPHHCPNELLSWYL